ncbi:MAG: hypothetical protein IT350_21335 [Deltaproteobacteria bacterium]|nr:hypothetical protein [Deltaproteobacteria bacterium]
MTTGDDLWRDEWLAELSDELRSMRGVIDSLAANPSDSSPWRRLERAWSRLAGQASFFDEPSITAIGVEAASLCSRVGRNPGIVAPDEVADALTRALDVVDAEMRRAADAPSEAGPIDDLVATIRVMAPANDPERDLRRLMGQARLLIDAWRAVPSDVAQPLAERAAALEAACDDITRGLADDAQTSATTASPGARAVSEVPDAWRRGVEQLATLRDELRDEHVSPRILGRFDAILRRLGSPLRAPDGTLCVLCARVADRRFAIPKDVVAAVRPARRPPGSRFAGDEVSAIWLGPAGEGPDAMTLHVGVETGRGRVAIGVTEVTGEATLWNVGLSVNADPRFPRIGVDADEGEWEILDVTALVPDAPAADIDTDNDGVLVAANGRTRPNAAPLLRALSRSDGGR